MKLSCSSSSSPPGISLASSSASLREEASAAAGAGADAQAVSGRGSTASGGGGDDSLHRQALTAQSTLPPSLSSHPPNRPIHLPAKSCPLDPPNPQQSPPHNPPTNNNPSTDQQTTLACRLLLPIQVAHLLVIQHLVLGQVAARAHHGAATVDTSTPSVDTAAQGRRVRARPGGDATTLQCVALWM